MATMPQTQNFLVYGHGQIESDFAVARSAPVTGNVRFAFMYLLIALGLPVLPLAAVRLVEQIEQLVGGWAFRTRCAIRIVRSATFPHFLRRRRTTHLGGFFERFDVPVVFALRFPERGTIELFLRAAENTRVASPIS